MKRIGLLVLMVAALGVTSLLADHKEGVRGRGGRFGAGAFRNGNGRGAGLPPGLQRHVDRTGQLPPGLQRRLERTGQLPPGLQRRRGGRFSDRGGFADLVRKTLQHVPDQTLSASGRDSGCTLEASKPGLCVRVGCVNIGI